MSIRDTVRRALRKSSASSGGSGTATPVSAVSSNTSQSSSTSSLHKTTNMISRAFTWSGRDKSDFNQPQPAKSPRKQKTRTPKVHPSEKPLTAENLRHQELLNQFTMTFGASDPSRLDSMSFYGVSPCCTRRPSIDGDYTSSTVRSSVYDIPSTYDEDMVPP